MNGAYGRRRYGFSSTRVTVNGRPSSRAASPRAPLSSRCTTPAPGRTRPVVGSKSLPVAIRSPSSAIRVALKRARALAGVRPTARVARMSQYSAVRNAIRCRSRSTTMRVATDCTRPAESRGMTFFHSTGETS